MLVVSIALSGPKPDDASSASVMQKQAALKKERRDVLQEVSREAEEVYKHGENIYLEVAYAVMSWRDAELELAQDRAARVKVREHMLEKCKRIEELAIDRFKRSQAAIDMGQAKAARLQAEIDLLREQTTD